MGYDPQRHHRRSIRLRGYDYRASGAYFVTICVRDRADTLCEIVGGNARLNSRGIIVERVWNSLPEHFSIAIDAFIVMPDHIHGIIWLIPPENEAPSAAGKAPSSAASASQRTGGSRPAPTAKPLGASSAGEAPSSAGEAPSASQRTGGSRPAPTAKPLGASAAGEAPSASQRTGGSRPAPTAKPLGAIIGALKTMSARQINAERGTQGAPFWQRDFYERVVRDEAELGRIREYIRRNPQRWAARRRPG